MNALLDRADIGTHVKIVIVGLIAAIVMGVIGIQAHEPALDRQAQQPARKSGPT